MNQSMAGKRIAILSSASGGGAGIAAKRVHDALKQHSGAEVDFVDMAALSERLPDDVSQPTSMSNRKVSDTHFTVEYSGFYRGWLVEMLSHYDVLNVHWSSYLISLSELDELSRRGISMLFTLHDFYYLTGGCHYPDLCTNYKTSCVACPQVDSSRCDATAIPKNHGIKKQIFSRHNVHLAAPSKFLGDKAVEAGIVPEARTHVLRNAYEPVAEPAPKDRSGALRIVLIADSLAERRKGMNLAIEALGLANETLRANEGGKSFVIDLVGNCPPELAELMKNSGLEYAAHGKITDHVKLVEIYQKCHFLLTCSYEDNWPNILVEAGSYGCLPIVGPGHGCEEFVDRLNFGFVSKGYSPEEFRNAIAKSIENFDTLDIESFSRLVRNIHDPSRISGSYASALSTIQIGLNFHN